MSTQALASRHLCATLGLALAVLTLGLATPSRSANVTFEDTEFVTSEWEVLPQAFGAGGDGTATRLTSGGNPGAHLEIRIDLFAAGVQRALVWATVIKPGALYDPSTQGEIVAVDWEEDTRLAVGRNAGHRASPALRQNGKLYAALLDSDPRFTPNTTWESVKAFQLVAEDFGSTNSSNDHPDFSATGAPIEFGFSRAASGLPNQPAGFSTTAIDNWKIEVNAPPRLTVDDEIRAATRLELVPVAPNPPVIEDDVQARSPRSLADRVDARTTLNALGQLDSKAHASLGVGLGSRSSALGPVNVETVSVREASTSGRASHLRKFIARSNSAATADIDIFMFADGSLDLRSVMINNPFSPTDASLSANLRLAVAIHRVSGAVSTPYERSAQLRPTVAERASLFTTPADFASYFTIRTVGIQDPIAVLDYAELLTAIATVPTNEEFGVEFILETAARADAEAGAWLATSDFENTMTFEISSPTPDVALEEVFADPKALVEGERFAGRATFNLDKLGRSKLDSTWSVVIDGQSWTAESDQGASLTGTLKAKGKSGRKFNLMPDPDSLKEFIGEFESHLEAETGKQAEVKLKGLKKAKAVLTRSRNGSSSKLTLKLDLLVKVKGKKRRGTWKIKLKEEGGAG